MPMRLACGHRECCRNRDHVRSGFGEAREKRRKAQIITDRQPQSAHRSAFDYDGFGAVFVHRAFAPALSSWQVDVEQVDFVVPRPDRTTWVDHERAVRKLTPFGEHGQRTEL